MREQLKDPDSAKFSSVKAVVDDDQALYVCGLVNAKNSYGGYTGNVAFQGLLISTGAFLPVAFSSDATDQRSTYEVCAANGAAL